jgi:hypothetical protein
LFIILLYDLELIHLIIIISTFDTALIALR